MLAAADDAQLAAGMNAAMHDGRDYNQAVEDRMAAAAEYEEYSSDDGEVEVDDPDRDGAEAARLALIAGLIRAGLTVDTAAIEQESLASALAEATAKTLGGGLFNKADRIPCGAADPDAGNPLVDYGEEHRQGPSRRKGADGATHTVDSFAGSSYIVAAEDSDGMADMLRLGRQQLTMADGRPAYRLVVKLFGDTDTREGILAMQCRLRDAVQSLVDDQKWELPAGAGQLSTVKCCYATRLVGRYGALTLLVGRPAAVTAADGWVEGLQVRHPSMRFGAHLARPLL